MFLRSQRAQKSTLQYIGVTEKVFESELCNSCATIKYNRKQIEKDESHQKNIQNRNAIITIRKTDMLKPRFYYSV